jgi:hypothetical protein
MAAQPIPEGYQTVRAYLGMIGHAELGIRDSRVLLADFIEFLTMPAYEELFRLEH